MQLSQLCSGVQVRGGQSRGVGYLGADGSGDMMAGGGGARTEGSMGERGEGGWRIERERDRGRVYIPCLRLKGYMASLFIVLGDLASKQSKLIFQETQMSPGPWADPYSSMWVRPH